MAVLELPAGSLGDKDSHVLHRDVLEDLAIVHVPHGLVVPHLGGQQDGAEDDAFPVAGADVHLGVRQQPFQVNLQERHRQYLRPKAPPAADPGALTKVTMAHSAVSWAELKSIRMKR